MGCTPDKHPVLVCAHHITFVLSFCLPFINAQHLANFSLFCRCLQGLFPTTSLRSKLNKSMQLLTTTVEVYCIPNLLTLGMHIICSGT